MTRARDARRRRRRGARRVLALALALVGCGAPEASRPAPGGLDLVERLPLADVRSETRRLALGDREARRHLAYGWSGSRRDGGRAFVEALGRRAVLAVDLVETGGDRTLILACRAARPVPGRRARVSLYANGIAVGGPVALGAETSALSWRLPAALLRGGRNELELRFPSAGARAPSAACETLRVEGGPDLAAPRADAGGGSLLLPGGAALAYYAELGPGARLEIERLKRVEVPDGTGADLEEAALEVEVATEGAGRARRLVVRPGPERRRVELLPSGSGSGSRSSWARIRLAAIGNGTLRLQHPVVYASRPRAHVATPGVDPPPPSARGGAAPPAGGRSDGAEASRGARARSRPNVFVYVVDTLRRDHVGVDVAGRALTPHLDAFAADAVQLTEASAGSSWTRPATASILTGLAPRSHRVRGRRDALAETHRTLAERLRDAGYRTGGFVANGNVAEDFGFAQGFDAYQLYPNTTPAGAPPARAGRATRPRARSASEWLLERAETFLSACSGAPPCLLYLHTIDAHSPYTPRPRQRARLAPHADPSVGLHETIRSLAEASAPPSAGVLRDLRALYAAEVAGEDERFGEFLALLRSLDLYAEGLVLFVSDHGEELADHGGFEHGRTLYTEQLRVPLLIKLPGGAAAGRRVAGVARHVDVVPTLLDWLGLPIPPELDGVSLLRRIAAAPHHGRDVPEPDETASAARFAELRLDGLSVESVEAGGYKLVHRLAYDRPRPRLELYDLRRDARELHDLASERPIAVGHLLTLLRERRADGDRGPVVKATPRADVEANLRALGYIE